MHQVILLYFSSPDFNLNYEASSLSFLAGGSKQERKGFAVAPVPLGPGQSRVNSELELINSVTKLPARGAIIYLGSKLITIIMHSDS